MNKKEVKTQIALGTIKVNYLPRIKGQKNVVVILNENTTVLIPFSTIQRINFYNPGRKYRDQGVLLWISKRIDKLELIELTEAISKFYE